MTINPPQVAIPTPDPHLPRGFEIRPTLRAAGAVSYNKAKPACVVASQQRGNPTTSRTSWPVTDPLVFIGGVTAAFTPGKVAYKSKYSCRLAMDSRTSSGVEKLFSHFRTNERPEGSLPWCTAPKLRLLNRSRFDSVRPKRNSAWFRSVQGTKSGWVMPSTPAPKAIRFQIGCVSNLTRQSRRTPAQKFVLRFERGKPLATTPGRTPLQADPVKRSQSNPNN